MRILFFILMIFVCTLLPFSSHAASDYACHSCHGKKGAVLFIDKARYEESSHGRFSCNRCHLDVSAYPHARVSRVNCGICHLLGTEGAPRGKAIEYKLSIHGMALKTGKSGAPDCQTCHGSHYALESKDERSDTNRLKIPAQCSRCHAKEYEAYQKSIHGKEFIGKKNIGAATCFDCHIEHRTPGVREEAWKLSLIRECGNCHKAELDTYRKTFHGKVTKLGYTTAAKCSDCHGSHNVLPAKERDSAISENYIIYTCRECHPKATLNFTKYYAHAEEHNREKYPVLYYAYLFMTALLLGVFIFFFTHTFLWAYRSLMERIRGRERED